MNGIENPKTDPYTYDQLIFSKSANTNPWRKQSLKKWCQNYWKSKEKEKKKEHQPFPHTTHKNNLRLTKEMNIKL